MKYMNKEPKLRHSLIYLLVICAMLTHFASAAVTAAPPAERIFTIPNDNCEQYALLPA
jgi:hypothetical protein